MSNSTGLYITIGYGSAHLALGLLLSFFIYVSARQSGESLKCTKFVRRLWKMRGVYASLIVHIYDTATNIGVLYEWYQLSQLEKQGTNIESLDMKLLFDTAISFMIACRIILGLFGGWIAGFWVWEDGAKDILPKCLKEKKIRIWTILLTFIVFIKC